jgi:hypothetical protein
MRSTHGGMAEGKAQSMTTTASPPPNSQPRRRWLAAVQAGRPPSVRFMVKPEFAVRATEVGLIRPDPKSRSLAVGPSPTRKRTK